MLERDFVIEAGADEAAVPLSLKIEQLPLRRKQHCATSSQRKKFRLICFAIRICLFISRFSRK